MKPLLTVVIPVYNVEKYLKRCIESILIQEWKHYDILLVDDGSTDNSPQICDDYAKAYDFISVIHKKNGGLSAARTQDQQALPKDDGGLRPGAAGAVCVCHADGGKGAVCHQPAVRALSLRGRQDLCLGGRAVLGQEPGLWYCPAAFSVGRRPQGCAGQVEQKRGVRHRR